MNLLARLALLWVLCAALSPSFAHSGGVSYLTWQTPVEDAAGHLESRGGQLDLPLPDLAAEFALDADRDGALRWHEVLAALPRVRSTIERRLTIETTANNSGIRNDGLHGQDCAIVAGAAVRLMQRDTGLHLRVPVQLRCAMPVAASSLRLNVAAWLREVPDHAVYVTEYARPGALTVLVGSRTALSVLAGDGRVLPADTFMQFAGIGIEHLLSGYDHLAFVALLLLGVVHFARRGASSRRHLVLEAVRAISAFTIAHSLTLALAAGGWLHLPAAPVEAAIAASIVIAALAILLGIRQLHGWRIAFAFGLIHGLGFASALAELLHGAGLALPLLAFNVGLELAQLGVALLAVPILWLLMRHATWATRATVSSAAMLGMLGTLWLWQRL